MKSMFNHTSTKWAPWYIVPADHKWFTRLAVAAVIYDTLRNLNLAYPTVSEQQKQALLVAKDELESEDGGKEDWAVTKAEAKAAEAAGQPEPDDLPQAETAAKKEKKSGKKKSKKKNK